jgi:PTS system mannose-specific IIA component
MSKDNQKDVIGIIAVSHCRLAEEMIRVAELIVGPLRACKAISFRPEQSVEEMTEELRETVEQVDEGKGVLILTDLFGGTPANISLALLGPNIEVVCGMNLPMLIKLASCRDELSLAAAAATVKEYGQRHISLASEVLSRSVRAQ